MVTSKKPPQPETDQISWVHWDDSPEEKKDARVSIGIGIIVTILFHLVVFFVVPWDHMTFVKVAKVEPEPIMDIEFVTIPKYMEANPNVESQKPKESDKISDRDQVAAQEVIDEPSDSAIPQINGEMLDTQKIVDGAPFEPSTEAVVEGQPVPESEMSMTEQQKSMPQPEQVPENTAPDLTNVKPSIEAPAMQAIEQEPVQEQGMKSAEVVIEEKQDVEEPGEAEAPPLEEVESPKTQVRVEPQPEMMPAKSGSPSPRPRPRIDFRVPSGPLIKNPHSAGRLGSVAIDSNFSEFGAYQQRMIEAISAQWHLLGSRAKYTSGDLGSRVVVNYTLNQEGEIVDLGVLYSNASSAGTLIVTDSIKSRAPFGNWTQDMIQVLGEEQDIRITFYYR